MGRKQPEEDKTLITRGELHILVHLVHVLSRLRVLVVALGDDVGLDFGGAVQNHGGVLTGDLWLDDGLEFVLVGVFVVGLDQVFCEVYLLEAVDRGQELVEDAVDLFESGFVVEVLFIGFWEAVAGSSPLGEDVPLDDFQVYKSLDLG